MQLGQGFSEPLHLRDCPGRSLRVGRRELPGRPKLPKIPSISPRKDEEVSSLFPHSRDTLDEMFVVYLSHAFEGIRLFFERVITIWGCELFDCAIEWAVNGLEI
jgi:hypothetical protein